MFLSFSTFTGGFSAGTLALHDATPYKISDPGELFSQFLAFCLDGLQFFVHSTSLFVLVTNKIIPFFRADVKGSVVKKLQKIWVDFLTGRSKTYYERRRWGY